MSGDGAPDPRTLFDDGHERAPDRYMARGRETVDRMWDLCHAMVPHDPNLADLVFAAACATHVLKYEDRAGHKLGVSSERDRAAAQWWKAMADHALGEGPDPRASRPNFVPYSPHPFSLDEL